MKKISVPLSSPVELNLLPLFGEETGDIINCAVTFELNFFIFRKRVQGYFMCIYVCGLYIVCVYIYVYICMYIYVCAIKNQLTTSIFSNSPEIFNTNSVKSWAIGASTISGQL